MELEAEPSRRSEGGLIHVPAISHIFTIDLVAEKLGYDKDQIFDIASDQLEPEDGMAKTQKERKRDKGDRP